MAKVVLITGVSRFLGGHLAGELVTDPSVDRVIGVDSIAPRRAELQRLGRTEFVRADIRNPLIAKVIAQAKVDTVVHTPLLGPARRVGGAMISRELGVVGTMQLLAACQKSDTVARVVVRSTTAVYGSGPRDPAVFTEDMHAIGYSAAGYAKEAVEVEGYVRGFMRRRPDIVVSILRLTGLIGPTVDSPLARYLSMPFVPTSLGFDPRLQLLFESDAVQVVRTACLADHPGVYNVAGDGVIPLSEAVRRAGRLRLPVPAPAIALVGAVVRNSGALDLSSEHSTYLHYGRAVDTTKLRTSFGYVPRYSTDEALNAYLQVHPSYARLGADALRALQAVTARVAETRVGAARALPGAALAPAG